MLPLNLTVFNTDTFIHTCFAMHLSVPINKPSDDYWSQLPLNTSRSVSSLSTCYEWDHTWWQVGVLEATNVIAAFCLDNLLSLILPTYSCTTKSLHRNWVIINYDNEHCSPHYVTSKFLFCWSINSALYEGFVLVVNLNLLMFQLDWHLSMFS